MMANILILAV
ncbi:unnamed protein product, partial [Rotaria sordida]